MPRNDVYCSISRLGSRQRGSVQRPVMRPMAPERVASLAGSPAAEKMDEKESPITYAFIDNQRHTKGQRCVCSHKKHKARRCQARFETQCSATIVYCRLAEKHSVATNEEGIHDERSPTERAHASPQVCEPVASQTRATMVKQ